MIRSEDRARKQRDIGSLALCPTELTQIVTGLSVQPVWFRFQKKLEIYRGELHKTVNAVFPNSWFTKCTDVFQQDIMIDYFCGY